MKRIMGALIALMMFVALSACASYDAQVDETVVEVDGYHVLKTDKNLTGCHGAGQSGYGGFGNDMFSYPAGQRTYSFTGASSESESDPVAVVTKDSQTLHQPGVIKFTLTSDCDALYDFHKKIGIKYIQADGKNWLRNFENDYLGVAISNGLNDSVSQYDWKAYYTDATLRTGVEAKLITDIQASVNQSLGSDTWIKINSVTLSKPIASETLTTGLESVEQTKLENQAIAQRNTGLLTKYDTMSDCLVKKRIPQETCQLMYLAESGGISFYPVPSGSGVNINTN